MSSNLFVALLGRGTFLEVETTEDGVLAETLFDFQLCFLHAAFLVESGLLLLALLFQGVIIGEEVELLGCIILGRYGCFRYDMVRGEIQPADEQVWIDTAVEECCCTIHDLA